MTQKTILRWFLGVVVGIIAILVIARGRTRHQLADQNPECPVDSVMVRDSAEHFTSISYKRLATSGNQTLIPEFNDCQQFENKADRKYGPLVGIFAQQALNAQIARMYQLAGEGVSVNAVPIAIIVDFGDVDYGPLGISRNGFGFNCLYMFALRDGDETTLHAFMLPVKAQADCDHDRAPGGSGSKPLDVVATRPSVGTVIFSGNDYPAVARWDWDSVAHEEYIGIGCLDAWCEIGNKNLHLSKAYSDPSRPKATGRVFEVKGWYDEEYLAVDDGTGTGKIAPSDVVGTLVPDPNLESYTMANGDFAGKWPTVATAYLTSASADYVKKLNLRPAFVTTGPSNLIALCEGDAQACGVPSTVDNTPCLAKPSDAWYGHPWYARIISATGDTVYRCVIRRPHDGMTIPGIVRWRWKNNDQVAWIKCDAGCCEVTGLK